MARFSLLQRIKLALSDGHDRGRESRTTHNAVGQVVPDPRRCVQCGICSYNCPIGIPVREFARRGMPVQHYDCITCGQCIQVCPRGTLRWETVAHALVVDTWMEQTGDKNDAGPSSHETPLWLSEKL